MPPRNVLLGTTVRAALTPRSQMEVWVQAVSVCRVNSAWKGQGRARVRLAHPGHTRMRRGNRSASHALRDPSVQAELRSRRRACVLLGTTARREPSTRCSIPVRWASSTTPRGRRLRMTASGVAREATVRRMVWLSQQGCARKDSIVSSGRACQSQGVRVHLG